MKLRPIAFSDLPTVKEWLEDESLLSLLMVEPPRLDMWCYTFIIELEDGTPVGWVDVFNVDPINRSAEVGGAIPDRRGRGLSLRVLDRIRHLAFEHMGLHRITMRVLASNEQVQRLLELYGLMPEGRLREACFLGDRYEDVLVYGLVKE